MRKVLLVLTAVVALVASGMTAADAKHKRHKHNKFPLVAGVVVGTVVGIGLHNTWFGSTAAGTGLGATTAGAVTGGFIAGVATATVIHSVTTPCTGFHAVFRGEGCKNGKYVVKRKHAHGWWW